MGVSEIGGPWLTAEDEQKRLPQSTTNGEPKPWFSEGAVTHYHMAAC